MKKIIIILVALVFAGIIDVLAQQTFNLRQQNSTIKITGTSSLHDWEMNVNGAKGDLRITMNGVGIESIDKVNFSVQTKEILSNNSTMDNKAHEALKAGKFPEIKFVMTSVDIKNSSNENFQGTLAGQLTIAGNTRTVSFPFNGKAVGMNTIKVSGKKPMKMSDFGIDPPRAMLGALKTGDLVNILFEMEYSTNTEVTVK